MYVYLQMKFNIFFLLMKYQVSLSIVKITYYPYTPVLEKITVALAT